MLDMVRSPEMPEAGQYETSEQRYAVIWNGLLEADSLDRAVTIRIKNISRGGLMATTATDFAVDDPVTVTIRHFGALAGRIAWCRDGKIGIEFDEDVDPLSVLAARQQSSAESGKATMRIVERTRSQRIEPFWDSESLTEQIHFH